MKSLRSGLSRFKVARLIDEAIAQEYVKFTFPKQQALDEEIAQICVKNTDCRMPLYSVSESWSSQEQLNVKLGGITATYLSEILKEGMKFGLALGTGTLKYGESTDDITCSGCGSAFWRSSRH
jgi:DNA-binding transcriptional regulator LsrR (DeoR family)